MCVSALDSLVAPSGPRNHQNMPTKMSTNVRAPRTARSRFIAMLPRSGGRGGCAHPPLPGRRVVKPGLLRLVIADRRRQPLVGRAERPQSVRIDGFTQEGHVTVHEQRVAAAAVEAERLVVDAAVVGPRPGAPRRAAERLVAVVDHGELVTEGRSQTAALGEFRHGCVWRAPPAVAAHAVGPSAHGAGGTGPADRARPYGRGS